MPKTIKELEQDINNIGKKFNSVIFGNGSKGMKTQLEIMKWQISIIIGMNIFIVGILVRYIIFK